MTVERPDTRFTWSGEFSIAYQVLGEGTTDLIYLPYWMSNVEANWDVELIARFLGGIASFSRLIVMDRRGVGCSDRFPPGDSTTMEEMVDDVLAVGEAAFCGPRTFLFGGQEAGFVAMLAAPTHPDRFAGLILVAAKASGRRYDEMPWEPSLEQYEAQQAAYRRASSALQMAEGYVRGEQELKGVPDRWHLYRVVGS